MTTHFEASFVLLYVRSP